MIGKKVKLIDQLVEGWHMSDSDLDELTLYLTVLNKMLERRIKERKQMEGGEK